MKTKWLFAALLMICLCIGGCSRSEHPNSSLVSDDPPALNGESQGFDRTMPPMDPNAFTESQQKWINLSESFYIVHMNITDELTDEDKADIFRFMISGPLYQDRVKDWTYEDGYAIPLADIEEIIFTHLDTSSFDSIRGFQETSSKWRYYDPDQKEYRAYDLGGYGGAAALGVLDYTEDGDRIRITLGSYQMEEYFSDPPVYTIQALYETEFSIADGEEHFKVLRAVKEEIK